MKLNSEKQIIRVQIWTNGTWRRQIRGTVIGTSDGVVGVLLDNGEYADVPEGRLRVIRKTNKRGRRNE